MKILIRKNLDGLEKAMSDQTSISFLDEEGKFKEGRTEQCHKKECDINNIIKKYDKHGLITHVNQAIAHYGDYTEINEFSVSMNTVKKAQELFDALPATVREKFGNDPGKYVEFVTNPENHEEMVKMGLAIKKVDDEVIKVEVTNGINATKAAEEAAKKETKSE